MKKILLAASAATAAFAALAAPANASVVIQWFPGQSLSTVIPGADVLFNFDTSSPTISGSGYLIQSGSNGLGADIPLSDSTGTKYLSVYNGGSVSFALPAAAANGFAFEWGSLDYYNTLIVLTGSDGQQTIIPGQTVLASLGAGSNGDQHANDTNGTVVITGDAGEVFTGLTLESTQNSFEIDNIAAIPEPATWALMVAGIAAVGVSMRRRARNVRVAFS